MTRLVLFACLSLVIPSLPAQEFTQQELSQILARRIVGLKPLASNEVLRAAVRLQNADPLTEAEIKRRDQAWREGKSPLIKSLQNNRAGKLLKRVVLQQQKTYSEAFLTDALGANVAAYPATTDYWQGDEEKFFACFNDTKVYVGPLRFDESSQSHGVQISLPVTDKGLTIGVLVIGVKLDQVMVDKVFDQ